MDELHQLILDQTAKRAEIERKQRTNRMLMDFVNLAIGLQIAQDNRNFMRACFNKDFTPKNLEKENYFEKAINLVEAEIINLKK